MHSLSKLIFISLQQRLPFTVLKRYLAMAEQHVESVLVATALTVYGIETCHE